MDNIAVPMTPSAIWNIWHVSSKQWVDNNIPLFQQTTVQKCVPDILHFSDHHHPYSTTTSILCDILKNQSLFERLLGTVYKNEKK